jgi:transposase-like protein
MKTDVEPTCCPECKSRATRVTATVNVAQWDRHFYKCETCELAFAGSWSSTHDDATAGVIERYGHATVASRMTGATSAD